MKKLIYLSTTVIVMNFMISCGSEASEDNTENNEQEVASADVQDNGTGQTAVSISPLGDPCVVSAEELGSILDLKKSGGGTPNAINSDEMKVCDYGGSNGSANVIFQRYKQKYIESEWLKDSYKKRLSEPNDKLTIQSVEADLGDEAIYKYGKEGPNNVYILEWRYGSHTQKSVVFKSGSKNDPEEKLQQLIQLAEKVK